MRLFDTHCHINFQPFEKDCEEVILRSQKNHLEMLVVGTDLKTSIKAIELAKKFDGVFAAVGFHPIHIENRDWRKETEAICELAKGKSVKAIGEIGFDTFYAKPENEKGSLKIQTKILDQFLALAFQLDKPVIFHCRGPLDLLRQKIQANLANLKKIGAVAHCFPGDQNFADFLIKNNFYLGFNGMIFKNDKWDKIISRAPLENILIETDAPYLTPPPFGKIRNEPINIRYIARRISELKNISVSQAAVITTQNAKRFLELD